MAVHSEPEAIDLVPITTPADQVLGGSIPEGDEEEYGEEDDGQEYSQQGYTDTDYAGTGDEGYASQHQYGDAEQHTDEEDSEALDDEQLDEDEEDLDDEDDDRTARLEDEEGGGDGPFGFRSIGIVGQRQRMPESLQADVVAPEAPGGVFSAGERSSCPSEGIPDQLPIPLTPSTTANVVPVLQMPRGKSHAHGYGDYMGRDSGRGSVQSLRMPVVHEEGESIAGSSSGALGEEQPPAPGAVSVSGRQVWSYLHTHSCTCLCPLGTVPRMRGCLMDSLPVAALISYSRKLIPKCNPVHQYVDQQSIHTLKQSDRLHRSRLTEVNLDSDHSMLIEINLESDQSRL